MSCFLQVAVAYFTRPIETFSILEMHSIVVAVAYFTRPIETVYHHVVGVREPVAVAYFTRPIETYAAREEARRI